MLCAIDKVVLFFSGFSIPFLCLLLCVQRYIIFTRKEPLNAAKTGNIKRKIHFLRRIANPAQLLLRLFELYTCFICAKAVSLQKNSN
jgi:hypothetical protein